MLWVLKRTVSSRHSFEHPKHMFKLIGKKIITIFFINWPYEICQCYGDLKYHNIMVFLYFITGLGERKSSSIVISVGFALLYVFKENIR